MLDDRYMPKYRFRSVCDITAEFLEQNGIRGLLLDIDNTLIYDETLTPLPGVKEWVQRMKSADIPLAIVSNAIAPRVYITAKRLGVSNYIYSVFVSVPSLCLCFIDDLDQED